MTLPSAIPRAVALMGFAVLTVLDFGSPAGSVRGASLPVEVRCPTDGDSARANAIMNRLDAARATGHLTAVGEVLRARNALPEFYLGRLYASAWIDRTGPSTCARRLVADLRAAGGDGLDGRDYHLQALEELMRAPGDGVDLDLLLTDAFLTFGSHLLQGRVNPETLEPEWLANRRSIDMVVSLNEALTRGDVDGVLASLRPRQPEYAVLRSTLAHLREVERAGGWGSVPGGPTLHPGDRGPRVVPLRRRLEATGDLPRKVGGADETLLDEDVADAVRRFQRRHGLEEDGSVGRETLAALNVPVATRIGQVIVNMERWRWLPDDLGRRHIRVNIADFRVEVHEGAHVVLAMKAVVGREYRSTPMFSAKMTYLVLSPYWHVPPLIAAADKLPEIRKDPGYLAAQHMTLLDAATNQPIDPTSVDWTSLTGAQLNQRYRIRQDPGPWNALGRVKFMFPNRHNVYLHDTPSRELFGRTARAFSSGCIRLEHPLELADYLLSGDPSWGPERIKYVIDSRVETTVRLSEPVPVHILYWTVFIDEDGLVNYRPDLYVRDQAVRKALDSEPPGP